MLYLGFEPGTTEWKEAMVYGSLYKYKTYSKMVLIQFIECVQTLAGMVSDIFPKNENLIRVCLLFKKFAVASVENLPWI